MLKLVPVKSVFKPLPTLTLVREISRIFFVAAESEMITAPEQYAGAKYLLNISYDITNPAIKPLMIIESLIDGQFSVDVITDGTGFTTVKHDSRRFEDSIRSVVKVFDAGNFAPNKQMITDWFNNAESRS